jgi:hypothetical protein
MTKKCFIKESPNLANQRTPRGNEPIITTPRNTNVLGKPPVPQRIRPMLTRQPSNSFSEENTETPLVKNTSFASSCGYLATPVTTSTHTPPHSPRLRDERARRTRPPVCNKDLQEDDYKVILAGMFNSKFFLFCFRFLFQMLYLFHLYFTQ